MIRTFLTSSGYMLPEDDTYAAMQSWLCWYKGFVPDFVLGFFFLGSIAMTVGIFDQAMDFAHRREKLDELENPFDPRHAEDGQIHLRGACQAAPQ